ncbi:MAG: branched-chain amino acid ABC transporter permease [Rhodospirillaceae bacterium]|jgi:branched-chain amino acid transport system permease protein|nr:branched-chain amino acid ABC transporter permease [Rhodospirillaceae bacterium]MBT4488640.1 branched-chain amino acid ABC transporter permease [Rhodospirillaceae bacterium]MBT5192916.1 branched-chain amino acid ABC transporter permease [Rhodospirillaceae bacterium]MBT5897937.1 branched-chain amino acid ABC transporter permease [Rhodospirillaceae bacterium]MBT6427660.1 branched-chain amino acid ABC transporter permease [Rhodospirillaceae bacterium]
MEQVVNAAISILFDGVAYGMLLFIISVGLSITMGLMGFANLAHGAFAMAGGYVLVSLMVGLGFPFIPALVLAAVCVAVISVPFERYLYRPLYQADELDHVLLSIGLVLMATAAITFVYGPSTVSITVPDYLNGQIDLGIGLFPAYRTFTIAVGALLILGLWYGFEGTIVGAKIRAAVDNRRMAQSIGINVDRLFVIAFALGSGLAALGGGLAIEIIGMEPTFALTYLVFFLIVVAVGGLGSIRGAFVAALLLGLIDTAGKYLWPDGGAFFIYAVTIAILLVRPMGLFGRS